MPEQIGKYRITEVIGTGAMGVVYKAFDPHIERVVALKTIRKELLGEGQRAEMLARFRNEARAAGRLAHPNVVAIYDYGEDAESAYIAMEYVDGHPLSALLGAGVPTDLAHVAAWMPQILRGLYYAHTKGVTHRDVKPANVLVKANDGVKVTDFGIAHIDTSNLTQQGSVIGTPNYMSPEQLLGDPIDGRSDVFSAGIVLYQMLTGERPFQGSSAEVMQKILNVDPPPPSALVPALGDAFDPIIAGALAKKPDLRYGTAGRFLAALLGALQSRVALGALAGSTLQFNGDDSATRIVARPQRPPQPQVAAPRSSAVAVPADATVDWRGLLAQPMAVKLAEITQMIERTAAAVVKRALEGTTNPAAFCAALDAHIATREGRAAIRRAADETLFYAYNGTMRVSTTQGTTSPSTTASRPAAAGEATGWPLAPVELAAVLDALTGHLIPQVAKAAVARAAKASSNRHEFIEVLAQKIIGDDERARFLRRVGGPPST